MWFLYSDAEKFMNNNGKISYDLKKGKIEESAIPHANSLKNSHEQMNKDIISLNTSVNNLKKSAKTSDEKEDVNLLENYLNKSMNLFDFFTIDKNLLVELENNEITWSNYVHGTVCWSAGGKEIDKKIEEFNSAKEDLKNFIKSHPEFANKNGLNNTSF